MGFLLDGSRSSRKPPHHFMIIFCIFSIPCVYSFLAMENDPAMEIKNEASSGGLTPLQKHVMFFDRNKDGIIYPSETYQGFRAIGCGVFLSSLAAAFIHLGLSRKTRPGKPFSFRFPIEVNNIKLSKHTSDSGVYDREGRFVEEKFEEIFSRHAKTDPNALTSKELKGLLKSNREPKDFAGWFAGCTEWKMLYFLCKDVNGLLHKEKVRGVFDGTLFEQMEKQQKKL